MKTINEGDLYNINKYTNLDEGIAEVAPELLECKDIKMYCERLRWARENLVKALEERVDE